MNQILLKIITPKGIFFNKPVDIVTVRTVTGYAGFLAGHIPYVSCVVPSKMNYRINQINTELYISGGIVQVQPEFVKIITDKVETNQERAKVLAQK